MDQNEKTILAIAEILRDSAAMNDAALAGDFDEARFRAQLIVGKADAAGHSDLVRAGARLLYTLGPAGTPPHSGYGARMLGIANELDRIGFTPL